MVIQIGNPGVRLGARDLEQAASELNDRLQQATSAATAFDDLMWATERELHAVADLNHIEFDAERPRKATVALALVNDRFGTSARKREDLA